MIWPLRLLFALLLALGLATQAARLRAEAEGRAPADLAASLPALGLDPAPPTLPDTLGASAPGCAEAIGLARVAFDGLGQAAARALLARPGTPRIVYLGEVGTRFAAPSIAARWAAASLLYLLGLRTAPPPRTVVLVMLPAACPALAALPWARLSPWR